MDKPAETVATLTELLAQTQSCRTVGDGKPYLILNDGQSVEEMEKILLVPSRKRGNPIFSRADSFTRYVNEHKTDATRIYTIGTTFIAVLDHHGKEPGWAEHKATFNMKLTNQWLLWTGQDKKRLNQKDFGTLIEDNLRDITAPVSAELLEMVRQFEATSTVEFKSFERGDNGNFGLSYIQTVQSRAGQKGTVELPKGFTLTIPAFEGSDPREIQSKLRFDISSGKLMLWFELQHVQEVLELHTIAAVDEITKETGIEPFYGQP